MKNVMNALEAWKEAIGPEFVIVDRPQRASAEKATFATTQRIEGIIQPADRSEVQACVKIANEQGVSLYTVSKGKNWGLGSRVPTRDGCVLMDLGRMDRIVDFDEHLSYITVEPGVTFRQAVQFLHNRNSSLYLSVIGGHPESSLIGNALERGDGIGPLGERIGNACGMEVVLAKGDCIQTGFERFQGSKVSRISRWGVGPQLDGLFSQSNFGVVTRMTFWLSAKPDYFQPFIFTMRDTAHMGRVVENLRRLQSQGILRGNSVAIWNAHKMIASENQYPWGKVRTTPLSMEQLKSLGCFWGESEWIGVGAFYSPTRRHAKADRLQLKKGIKRDVDRLIFIDRVKSWVLQRLKIPIRMFMGVDVEDVLRSLYHESVFLGHPTERSTRSTYWRKQGSLPKEMDPDRDHCGVVWLCPVVPFEKEHLKNAIQIVEKIAYDHGFEPQIAYIFPSERSVYMFPSIVYDRDIPGEDERAMGCHDRMFEKMVEAGYLPYRLGVQSMTSLPSGDLPYERTVRHLKDVMDPKGILSPGRYESAKETQSQKSLTYLRASGE